MSLDIHQKSLYLIIFNATMISRSIGKSIGKEKLAKFKIKFFQRIEKLISKLNSNILTEKNIKYSIRKLSTEFDISFGQAQKPVNVILKYHYYLNHQNNIELKKVLHCPIDSEILISIGIKKALTKIKEPEYFKIQKSIREKNNGDALSYDDLWEKQILERSGLWAKTK
jgi:hypothetical protein